MCRELVEVLVSFKTITKQAYISLWDQIMINYLFLFAKKRTYDTLFFNTLVTVLFGLESDLQWTDFFRN